MIWGCCAGADAGLGDTPACCGTGDCCTALPASAGPFAVGAPVLAVAGVELRPGGPFPAGVDASACTGALGVSDCTFAFSSAGVPAADGGFDGAVDASVVPWDCDACDTLWAKLVAGEAACAGAVAVAGDVDGAVEATAAAAAAA